MKGINKYKIKNIFRKNHGITLIALVITIIVLLILAGVSITMLTGDNAILSKAGQAKEATRGAQVKEFVNLAATSNAGAEHTGGDKVTKEKAVSELQEKGELTDKEVELLKDEDVITIGGIEIDFSVLGGSRTWTYDANKLTCTCGTTTVKIGDYVDYSPTAGMTETTYTSPSAQNGYGDQTFSSKYTGKWQVLGVDEEGCLMLISSDIIKTTSDVTFCLQGQNGYVNGITELNKISAIYGKGKYAKSARSVNVDDVNKITGYVDNVFNAETSNVKQTGNQVTYTLNSDGKIHYKGTKYPTTDKTSIETSFTYWTGSEWKTLKSGESATLTNNYYYYYPQTLSTTESSETTIKNKENSKNAYDLLFANTSSSHYWLGSQYVNANVGHANFGLRDVNYGCVGGDHLSYSNGITYNYYYGVRPAVSLESTIKLEADGENNWKIK